MKSRRVVVMALMVGVANFFPFFAGAASGPLLKPTRVGQTIVWRGKKYTAIKKGKNVIWDSGVIVRPAAETTPSSSPAPSSSPTPSPAPTKSVARATLQEIVLAKSSDVAVGETKKFKVGKAYFVSRSISGIRIFDDVCTHEGCAVEITGRLLVCPCHLAEYNPADGSVTKGPAGVALRSYESKEIDGKIIVIDYA